MDPAKLAEMEAKLESERRARVENAINAIAERLELNKEACANWVEHCLADESGSTLRNLQEVAALRGQPNAILGLGYSGLRGIH